MKFDKDLDGKVSGADFRELESYMHELPTAEEHKKLVYNIEKSIGAFRKDNEKFKAGFET